MKMEKMVQSSGPATAADARWSHRNTKNCTLIMGIHPLRVSLSVLQPSGGVINLRTDRPGTHPARGLRPDPYTIPFLVGLEEPYEFVYGSWAKECWSISKEKPAGSSPFHLWQVGMALYGNYALPEDQVVQHSESHSSTVSVELLLAQFIRYVVNLVEGIQWDDQQKKENLFQLKNHIIIIMPFWMSSLSRQRILNAVQVVGMTASLVNEGTLAASVFFHVHPLLPPPPGLSAPERKLLLFVEHSGNVDLYLFVEEDDGCAHMITFTGNTHFFPEIFEIDEIPELKEELRVFGQQFKKAYNKLGRGTDEGRRRLIWGLLRDLKLRMPRRLRPLYAKPIPVVCVAESDVWEKMIIEECNAYFGAFMLPCDDDEMAIPPNNGGVPKGSCSMLWHRNVNYTALFDQIASEKLDELKAYDLLAVEYFERGSDERADWSRLNQGSKMELIIYPGTKKVVLTERNVGTGKDFPIGTLTIAPEAAERTTDWKLEVKFSPKLGMYSWTGIWETDFRGNVTGALQPGKDYEWKAAELTVQAVEEMKNELFKVVTYVDGKNATVKHVESLVDEYEEKLKNLSSMLDDVPGQSTPAKQKGKKKQRKSQAKTETMSRHIYRWEAMGNYIRLVMDRKSILPVFKLEEILTEMKTFLDEVSK